MSVIFPICTECKRFEYKKTEEGGFHYWCDAFPEGIPGDVMYRNNLDETEECNNGIGYVPEEKE